MNETTKTVARVNKVNILLIENGEKRVPIRPICDALGIAYQGQIDKLKTDEILGSTLMPNMTVGADGKERELMTIPFKFVFGWLFTINPKNVNPSAKDAVLKYKLECYEALYKHFTEHTEFLEQKQKALKGKLEYLDEVKAKFHSAKEEMEKAKAAVDKVKDLSFEQWKADGMQLKIDF